MAIPGGRFSRASLLIGAAAASVKYRIGGGA